MEGRSPTIVTFAVVMDVSGKLSHSMEGGNPMIVTFAVAMDVAGKLCHCIEGRSPIARREGIP